MNIVKTDLDPLNAVVKITVDRTDYESKVNTVLSEYRKNANIPGFRKGHVPMGMIKKQYQQAVTADEVNKLLRENLENFIREEKLDLLGNPLPKAAEEALIGMLKIWILNLNWDFLLSLRLNWISLRK